MWVFTSEGFYSAVIEQRGKNKGKIIVRAREPGALELLRDRYMPALGETSIMPKGVTADYRYRAWIDRADFADGMAEIARQIDYPNFKSEAAHRRGYGPFEKMLHGVWSLTAKLQPGGPYNQGGSGYPPIPEDEGGKPKQKRKSKKAYLKTAGELPMSLVEESTDCEDCGLELDAETGEVFGGRWLCKDITGCSNRAFENKPQVRR
jgi:hypothetical protein